jgi:hypothetical protein
MFFSGPVTYKICLFVILSLSTTYGIYESISYVLFSIRLDRQKKWTGWKKKNNQLCFETQLSVVLFVNVNSNRLFFIIKYCKTMLMLLKLLDFSQRKLAIFLLINVSITRNKRSFSFSAIALDNLQKWKGLTCLNKHKRKWRHIIEIYVSNKKSMKLICAREKPYFVGLYGSVSWPCLWLFDLSRTLDRNLNKGGTLI